MTGMEYLHGDARGWQCPCGLFVALADLHPRTDRGRTRHLCPECSDAWDRDALGLVVVDTGRVERERDEETKR